jgi:hypothetical protein
MMEQEAAALRVVPQLVVKLKSEGLAPVTVMPVMLSKAVPVLVSVAVCDELAAPLTALKVSADGASVALGGAMAAKFAVTVTGPFIVTLVLALVGTATPPVQ